MGPRRSLGGPQDLCLGSPGGRSGISPGPRGATSDLRARGRCNLAGPNRRRPAAGCPVRGTGSDGCQWGGAGRLAFENEIANSVAIRGNLAFVAFGLHGLVVAETGRDGVRRISELPSPGWSHDVKLRQEQALLADWDYGLRVVDIRVPERPVEIGVAPTPATAIALALGNSPDGRPMVAVAEGHGGVSLIDLSNPAHPALIARASLGLNPKDQPHPESGGWAHGIAWSGQYLFVANWKRGLTVVDVQDLQRPRIAVEYNTGGTALGVQTETAPDGSISVFLAGGEAGLIVLRLRLTIDDLRLQAGGFNRSIDNQFSFFKSSINLCRSTRRASWSGARRIDDG